MDEHRVEELKRQIEDLENRGPGDPSGDPKERLAHLRSELKAEEGPETTTAQPKAERAVKPAAKKRTRK